MRLPDHMPSFEEQPLFLKRDKESGLDRLLKLAIAPAALLSGLFTAELLAGIWGVESLMRQISTVAGALIVTAAEIYFLRIFVQEDDYMALSLGLLIGLVSVAGSFGAFQKGVVENTLKSDAYQLRREEVRQLDRQIHDLQNQASDFRLENLSTNCQPEFQKSVNVDKKNVVNTAGNALQNARKSVNVDKHSVNVDKNIPPNAPERVNVDEQSVNVDISLSELDIDIADDEKAKAIIEACREHVKYQGEPKYAKVARRFQVSRQYVYRLYQAYLRYLASKSGEVQL